MLEPSPLIYIFAIMIYTKWLCVVASQKGSCPISVFECYIREYRYYFQWAGKFLAPHSETPLYLKKVVVWDPMQWFLFQYLHISMLNQFSGFISVSKILRSFLKPL